MAADTQHKSEGTGKSVVVYFCILALAALQFVIAYQNITAAQMFRRMLSVAIVEAGVAVTVLYAPLDGKARISIVCGAVYSFRAHFDAVWVDRQLPAGPLCRILFVRLLSVLAARKSWTAMNGKGSLIRMQRSASPTRLVLIVAAALVVMATPLPALAQSCALCYTQAASSGARMIQALRSGILILIVPPTLMSVGMIFIMYRNRNRCRETAEPNPLGKGPAPRVRT